MTPKAEAADLLRTLETRLARNRRTIERAWRERPALQAAIRRLRADFPVVEVLAALKTAGINHLE